MGTPSAPCTGFSARECIKYYFSEILDCGQALKSIGKERVLVVQLPNHIRSFLALHKSIGISLQHFSDSRSYFVSSVMN